MQMQKPFAYDQIPSPYIIVCDLKLWGAKRAMFESLAGVKGNFLSSKLHILLISVSNSLTNPF